MNALIAAILSFIPFLLSYTVFRAFRSHRKKMEELKVRNPEVIIVREYGEHPESGLWFYEDGSCRFGPLACKVIERHFNGMFLFKGKVYVLSKKSANAKAAKVRESLGVPDPIIPNPFAGQSLPDLRNGTEVIGDNGPAPDRAAPLPPPAPPAAKS